MHHVTPSLRIAFFTVTTLAQKAVFAAVSVVGVVAAAVVAVVGVAVVVAAAVVRRRKNGEPVDCVSIRFPFSEARIINLICGKTLHQGKVGLPAFVKESFF